MEVDRAQSLGGQAARISADEFRPEAGALSGDRRAERLHRGVSRRDESGGLFRPGCGVDLRRPNRRAKGLDDRLDAWLARPLLAVPRLERPTALDYRDDGDRTGTVQCGAAAAVLRDRVVQHGIELGERPLLGDRTAPRDAVHEHQLPLDPRTAISDRGAAAERSLHPGIRPIGSTRESADVARVWHVARLWSVNDARDV